MRAKNKFAPESLKIAGLVLTLSALTTPISANTVSDVLDSFENSAVSGSLRYRYEFVDQDNALSNANAGTLKARLTFKSTEINGFSSVLEFDHVASIRDDYNSTSNGNTGQSVVADVEGSNLNQIHIKYSSNIGDLSLGRQRINLGTQRYVGGVAFRQNEQTFDALTYNYNSESLSFSYSYIDEVHRIFEGDGNSVQTESFDSNSHLARLSFGDLNTYIYALDFSNGLATSTITYGLDYKLTLSDLTLTGAIAQQSDYGDNPISYDALYYSLTGAYKVGGVTLTAGYEVMGSDDGIANFATPLSTLHKWAGWADLFLGTGSSTGFTDGLEDFQFGVSGTLKGVSLGLIYHDFTGEESGDSLGTEIDAIASYKFAENISGELKYANYSADDFGVDTEKLWLTLTVNL